MFGRNVAKARTIKRPGRPKVHEEDRQLFSLRLDPELHRVLRMAALAKGQSLNDLLVEVIGEWWARHPGRAHFERLAKER